MAVDPYELNRLINYWMKAEFMRVRYQAIVDEHGAGIAYLVKTGQRQNLETSSAVWHMNILLDYWLATLYLVSEGWRELKLEDPMVDKMLGLHADWFAPTGFPGLGADPAAGAGGGRGLDGGAEAVGAGAGAGAVAGAGAGGAAGAAVVWAGAAPLRH